RGCGFPDHARVPRSCRACSSTNHFQSLNVTQSTLLKFVHQPAQSYKQPASSLELHSILSVRHLGRKWLDRESPAPIGFHAAALRMERCAPCERDQNMTLAFNVVIPAIPIVLMVPMYSEMCASHAP